MYTLYEFEFVALVGISAGLLGLLFGLLLHKFLGRAERKSRDLEKNLEAAVSDKTQFKQEVATHFSSTAALLNDFTQKYKEIHEHLAQGADELCRDDEGNSLLQNTVLDSDAAAKLDKPLSPPLDYAPKDDAKNSGTLAEDYGLEKLSLNRRSTDSSNNVVPPKTSTDSNEAPTT